MVRTREITECTSVRLFFWNEKLTRNQISDSEGLCVFVIRSEYKRFQPCECCPCHRNEFGERRCTTAIPFDLSKLANKDPSLVPMLLAATLQFLPGTVKEAGNNISSLLFSKFSLPQPLLPSPRPTYVIAFEISHVRLFDLPPNDPLGDDLRGLLPPPIPSFCRFEKDWDEEEELLSSVRSADPVEFRDDPYHRYPSDVVEYLSALRDYTGEAGICPTKPPIKAYLPRGFVEEIPCSSRGWHRRRSRDNLIVDDDTCPVCFEDFKHEDYEVTTTYCSHNFHTRCLLPWLQKNNTCPTCRAAYPLHYSPLFNPKRRKLGG